MIERITFVSNVPAVIHGLNGTARVQPNQVYTWEASPSESGPSGALNLKGTQAGTGPGDAARAAKLNR